MKECKKCGAVYNDEAQFCTKCGTPLTKPKQLIKRCEKCGLVYDRDDQFCTKCGSKLVEDWQEVDGTKTEHLSKNTVPPISAISNLIITTRENKSLYKMIIFTGIPMLVVLIILHFKTESMITNFWSKNSFGGSDNFLDAYNFAMGNLQVIAAIGIIVFFVTLIANIAAMVGYINRIVKKTNYSTNTMIALVISIVQLVFAWICYPYFNTLNELANGISLGGYSGLAGAGFVNVWNIDSFITIFGIVILIHVLASFYFLQQEK